MQQPRRKISLEELTPFNRDPFGTGSDFTYIGDGVIGGKATGLAFIRKTLASSFLDSKFEGITVNIPYLTVIATGMFDRYMDRNRLHDLPYDTMNDDRIAWAFQKADLPTELLGDLRALITTVHSPLAIRSSSRLEDALYEPFAGVYATKMIPNNQHDIDSRFRRLVEAVKYVYASMFFEGARQYLKTAGKSIRDEKMAVIIQEVVGQRCHDRFYPTLAGVARSYSFYPMGHARPEDGTVDLALGLGKTIVDGGLAWCYCPSYPRAVPPVGSPSDLLKMTQNKFWAINMASLLVQDPVRETEYMVQGELSEAEYDGTLKYLASTYRPEDDRIVSGIGNPGPRVVNFEPILDTCDIPLNDLIKELLRVCEEALGCEVETEFAMTLDPKSGLPARLGFLQVRPMLVSHDTVGVEPEEMNDGNSLAASDRVMGNGVIDTIEDVIFVRPDAFDARNTRLIAGELQQFNTRMGKEGRRYLLIGFGRWGSSDPWLGIPVYWGQISGALAIVEATLPNMNVELSQGSHFFHNLCSFQVCYFSVPHSGHFSIDWDWLNRQQEIDKTAFIKHVRTQKPLTIKVDGRTSRGVIQK